MSHSKPPGRMKYDEGAGLVLFVHKQQVQAFSLIIPAHQPLWVSTEQRTGVLGLEKNIIQTSNQCLWLSQSGKRACAQVAASGDGHPITSLHASLDGSLLALQRGAAFLQFIHLQNSRIFVQVCFALYAQSMLL